MNSNSVDFNNKLDILIGVLLNKYFLDINCLNHIIGRKYENISLFEFPIILIKSEQIRNVAEVERCQGFLINSDEPLEEVTTIEDFVVKNSAVNFNERKYIILVQNVSNFCNNLENCYKIFKFVFDILVIDTVKFELYTYALDEEDQLKWILLDKWISVQKSFLKGNELFPNRLAWNIGHKKLLVGGCDYLPYSNIESRMGTELVAILEYAEKFNFQVEVFNDEEYWGEIYPNWTGTGILGGVVMDKYDVGLGALFALPDRILYSDFSKPTTLSRVSCIVPGPILSEDWWGPIPAFNSTLWFLIIFTYTFVIFIIKITRRHLSVLDTQLKYLNAFTILSILFSQSIPKAQLVKNNNLRIIFYILLSLTVVIAATYNSRVSSLLIVPVFSRHILTVEDLAESKILWGELAIDWVLPLRGDLRPFHKILNDKFRVEDEDTLRSLSQGGNFAFGTERLSTGYFAIGSYFREDVVKNYRVLKEDMYVQYTCFQLKRSSVLRSSIDKFLLKAAAYGLLLYWETQANLQHTNHMVQKTLIHPPKIDTVGNPLRIAQLKGEFMILIMGYCIALIVFIFEVKFQNKFQQ